MQDEIVGRTHADDSKVQFRGRNCRARRYVPRQLHVLSNDVAGSLVADALDSHQVDVEYIIRDDSIDKAAHNYGLSIAWIGHRVFKGRKSCIDDGIAKQEYGNDKDKRAEWRHDDLMIRKVDVVM